MAEKKGKSGKYPGNDEKSQRMHQEEQDPEDNHSQDIFHFFLSFQPFYRHILDNALRNLLSERIGSPNNVVPLDQAVHPHVFPDALLDQMDRAVQAYMIQMR